MLVEKECENRMSASREGFEEKRSASREGVQVKKNCE